MLKRVLILILVLVLLSSAVVFGGDKLTNSSNVSISGETSSSVSQQVYYDDALEIEFEQALAEYNEVSSNAVLEVLEVFGAILDAKDSEEKYWLLVENNEKLGEIYDKITEVENALYKITIQLEIARTEERIEERNVLIRRFTNFNKPYYKSIYNLVTNNGKDKMTTGWFDNNYEKIYNEYLDEWGKSTIEGNTVPLMIISYIDDITNGGDGDVKTLPELYDKYAYMIYPWEHLGYNYRESQRNIDLITTMQNACLLDMYYECRNRIEGTDKYKEFQQQLHDKLKKYETTCKSLPIKKLEKETVCQIQGLEGKKFSLTVDYLSLAGRVRSACQNPNFGAIYIDKFDTNKNLLDNAFDYVNVFTDANLTKAGSDYPGKYIYQQESTYRIIWNYYKERKAQGKLASSRNYYDLYGALSMHGFTGLDGVGNLYLVVDPQYPYKAYGNGITRNYVKYRSFYLHIKTWKRKEDSIWLKTFDNVGNYARQSLIVDCNFQGSQNMDEPGYNAHNNFISLREIK